MLSKWTHYVYMQLHMVKESVNAFVKYRQPRI
jgi:hypothetical protein